MFDPKRPQRWRRVVDTVQSLAGRIQLRNVRRARSGAGGQAMVEYVLIAVLVILGLVTILTITGPTIGNVFSNTVYNLLGQQFTPYATLNAQTQAYLATAIASYTPSPVPYFTNTPVAPTCQPAHSTRTYAPTAPGAEGTFVNNPCP